MRQAAVESFMKGPGFQKSTEKRKRDKIKILKS
jgi:hypothetical protein